MKIKVIFLLLVTNFFLISCFGNKENEDSNISVSDEYIMLESKKYEDNKNEYEKEKQKYEEMLKTYSEEKQEYAEKLENYEKEKQEYEEKSKEKYVEMEDLINVLDEMKLEEEKLKLAKLQKEKEEKEKKEEEEKEKPVEDKKEEQGIPIKTSSQLAIIIDDVGENLNYISSFMSIDEPLTFAVLPFLKKSRESADILKKSGYEVLLHLPMEGSNAILNAKTKGLIKTGMSKGEIRDKIDSAIKNVGSVNGFNNHMGSKVTADPATISDILEYSREKNLYYIDSRTTSKSHGYKIAKAMGIPAYYCSHFIDTKKNVDYIKEQIKVSAKLAKQSGSALVIGHYDKNTAKAIKEMIPYLEKERVELVSAKKLIR